jgi:hypothetical protein
MHPFENLVSGIGDGKFIDENKRKKKTGSPISVRLGIYTGEVVAQASG